MPYGVNELRFIIFIFIFSLIPLIAQSNISNEAELKIINSTCKKIGFKQGTEAFGECFLKIRKKAKESEKKKQQSLALFESKIVLNELDNLKIKTKCENLGFQPKTEKYGQCFLKLRSKTKLNKKLQEIGIKIHSSEYVDALSISKNEIKREIGACQFLGFKKDSTDFYECVLSSRTKLENSKRNKYIALHFETKKNKEELRLQQIQIRANKAQIKANADKVAKAMKTQEQTSGINSDDVLQSVFFLLQVGLTLYSLGAFNYAAPANVQPYFGDPCGGFHACGFEWNPLGLDQIPM